MWLMSASGLTILPTLSSDVEADKRLATLDFQHAWRQQSARATFLASIHLKKKWKSQPRPIEKTLNYQKTHAHDLKLTHAMKKQETVSTKLSLNLGSLKTN